MSHLISLQVTKFRQPLLITPGVADEKPEGGKKPPPPEDRVNAPNGSHDIPSQSQRVEQNGYRHFVGFQPHFHVNMT